MATQPPAWGLPARPTRRERTTTTQAAVAKIKAYIRDHQLRPGDHLPSEADLCQTLGFSRSSIREAIRILATLDIVEVRHGFGTFVSNMSLQSLVDGLIFRAVLDADRDLRTLRNIIDTREAIELSIAEEAAAGLNPELAKELLELVDHMAACDAAGESFADFDQRFHQLLLSTTSNSITRELNDAFWQVHMAVLPALDVGRPRNMAQTVAAHRDIVTALLAGDLPGYRDAVRCHYEPLRTTVTTTAQP